MQSTEGWKNFAMSDLSKITVNNILLIVNGSHLPIQLQLPKPNVELRIVISSRSELDVLRFTGTLEPRFRSLVEALNNMVDVLMERRVLQETYPRTH